MQYLSSLVVSMVMVTCIDAHGRLIVPPARSAMWRTHNNVPRNPDDMGLDCGGQGTSWTGDTLGDRGHCGVCGDPWTQSVRQNEAGGKYATGIIGATYREGDIITVVLTITVSHGGWSEFRICPNNNVHRVVSQDCLDKRLLYTVGGKTRFYHPVRTGDVTIQLVLPKDLTCSQCVLQWWWKTNANNNCRPSTGQYCCIGCGRQEIFVNCADVAIVSSTKPAVPFTFPPQTHAPPPTRPPTPFPIFVPRTTQTPRAVPPTTPARNHNLPDRFVPINTENNLSAGTSAGTKPAVQHPGITIASGFLPIDSGSPICVGSISARRLYGWNVIDRWCQSQCRLGICPAVLCSDTCRV